MLNRKTSLARWYGRNKAMFAAANSGVAPITYLLQDEFTATIAAGSLNGTLSSDGKSARTVNDTASHLSQAGGKLVADGGAGYGNPGLWHDLVLTRTAGRVAQFLFSVPVTKTFLLGIAKAKSGLPEVHSILCNSSGNIAQFDEGGGGAGIGAYEVATNYIFTIVIRATGADYFIKGGAYTNQEFIWRYDSDTTASLYTTVCNNDSAISVDYVRIPETLWLPVPLLSDGFAAWGTSNGLGHAEGVAGGLGSGGAGKAWVDTLGTWAVTGGKANASALVDSLALATSETSNPNVNIFATLARTAGTVAVLLRYVDADNYIYAGHDGTNALLVARVAGTETTVATAAAAFGGGIIKLFSSGTKFRMFWNDGIIDGEKTIADAALQTSGKHGLYTTNIANTFDNLSIYARGS